MSKINRIGLLILVLLATIGFTAQAQQGVVVPAFATVEAGTLYIYNAEGAAQAVYNAADFQSLAWNADGSKLAFVMRDANYQSEIGVMDAGTGTVTTLVTPSPDAGFNINWTRDGRILFAASDMNTMPESGLGMNTSLYAIVPQADAQVEALGTFEYMAGCGGGSPIPADWVYWRETAGFGGYFLTLADTPYGIVHSKNCGGTGLELLNVETGVSVTLSDTLVKAIVSPDGTHIAGMELDYEDRSVLRVLVYDLASLQAVEVDVVEEPDQLAWSMDGQSLYYSVRTPDENLVGGLTIEQKAILNQTFGFEMEEIPAFMSSIRRVDLVTGDDTHLFQNYSYAIGRMVEDGGVLYFSQIPNLNGWLNALVNGEIAYEFDTRPHFVEPFLMRLDVQTDPEAAVLGKYDQFTPAVIR